MKIGKLSYGEIYKKEKVQTSLECGNVDLYGLSG